MPIDYFAEVGDRTRALAGWIVAFFAALFWIFALLAILLGILNAAINKDAKDAFDFAGSATVVIFLAGLLSFVARRLLRNVPSANGFTLLPTWLIQVGGVLLLFGSVIALAEGPKALSLELCGSGIAAGLSAIFLPWFIRRRLSATAESLEPDSLDAEVLKVE